MTIHLFDFACSSPILNSRHRLRRLARTINNTSPNQLQINLNRKRLALSERIVAWKERSPAGVEEDGFEDLNEMTCPEIASLGLPSTFPPSGELLYSSLQGIEKELRQAQVFDCLRALRKCLSERVALLQEKNQRARGRYESSRSTATIKVLEEEILFLAA